MNIICIQTGDLLVNTYLCHAEDKKETVIIDPGGSFRKIESVIKEYGLIPKAVLLTHGHFDHIGALEQIREAYDTPVYIHTDDADMLTDSRKNLSAYMFNSQVGGAPAEQLLSDGQKLSLFGLNFEVIATPGHSPGSVIYRSNGVAFTGDTVFKRSIGRTDFYGCSANAMKESLEKVKQRISGETKLFPGHGEATTMAEELQDNIYLNR